MDESLRPLLEKAFHSARAQDANSAIAQARERSGAEEPFSYELLLNDGETLRALAERVVPRLVYHLESHGAHLPGCEGVFLSLFAGERLHFIHARDAMPLFAGALGTSLDALSQAHGTGELRRALRPEETPRQHTPPLMLPGKTK